MFMQSLCDLISIWSHLISSHLTQNKYFVVVAVVFELSKVHDSNTFLWIQMCPFGNLLILLFQPIIQLIALLTVFKIWWGCCGQLRSAHRHTIRTHEMFCSYSIWMVYLSIGRYHFRLLSVLRWVLSDERLREKYEYTWNFFPSHVHCTIDSWRRRKPHEREIKSPLHTLLWILYSLLFRKGDLI